MNKRQRLILGGLLVAMVYLIVRIFGEEYARFEDQKQSEQQALVNQQLEEEIAFLEQKLMESQTVAKKVYQKRMSQNLRFSNERVYKIVDTIPTLGYFSVDETYQAENERGNHQNESSTEFMSIPQKWWDVLWAKRRSL